MEAIFNIPFFFFFSLSMGTTTSKQKQQRKLSLKPVQQEIQHNAVNLVRHQVVLSDHVSPMSSLSAVISIPMRRSSWRKSIKDNTSSTSSFYDEDDDVSSPRTSVGSSQDKDIVFESKYLKNEEITIKSPPRPFWVHNRGDEKEYDR